MIKVLLVISAGLGSKYGVFDTIPFPDMETCERARSMLIERYSAPGAAIFGTQTYSGLHPDSVKCEAF